MRFTSARHLLIGSISSSSWCSLHALDHRGLATTRDETKTTCRNCLSSLRAFRAREAARLAAQPKNVTPQEES